MGSNFLQREKRREILSGGIAGKRPSSQNGERQGQHEPSSFLSTLALFGHFLDNEVTASICFQREQAPGLQLGSVRDNLF
jgi:hypothetical protein